MNKKQKSSIILSSLAAIAVAGSLIAGSTYALFTSDSKTNIAVTSGKVDVVASIDEDSLVTYSGVNLTGNSATDELVETGEKGKFTNGGTAEITNEGDVKLEKVTPGDKVTFNIDVTNNSNVAIKYRTIISFESDSGLFSGLSFKIDGVKFDGLTNKSKWTALSASETSESIATLPVEIELPSSAGNQYQDTSCTVSFTVEAVQGNAETTDPDENVIEIDNAAQLGVFRDIVNSKTTAEQKAAYNGKTIKLTNDIDLNNANWTPINWNYSQRDSGFAATFDGNDKTISNFNVDVGADGKKSAGLFAYGYYLTFNKLHIKNANITGTNAVGAIVGVGYGVTISDCSVTYSTITAKTWWTGTKWDDGDKVGALAGRLDEGGNHIKGSTSDHNTIKAYRDMGGLVGFLGGGSGDNSATENIITNNTLICDKTHNDEGYTTDDQYNVNEVVGRTSLSPQIETNTTENNTIQRISE